MPPLDDDRSVIDADELAAWLAEQRTVGERYLFGLCGPPGVGKSTIAARVGVALSAPVVSMDGYHHTNDWLDAAGLRWVKGAPETFDADAFVRKVGELRSRSGDVAVALFDRQADEPVPDGMNVPVDADIIVVEGNYLLLPHDPWCRLRELFDAVGFVDLDTSLRRDRLIARHIEFGATPGDAREFAARSDDANAALVDATRSAADVIVIGS